MHLQNKFYPKSLSNGVYETPLLAVLSWPKSLASSFVCIISNILCFVSTYSSVLCKIILYLFILLDKRSILADWENNSDIWIRISSSQSCCMAFWGSLYSVLWFCTCCYWMSTKRRKDVDDRFPVYLVYIPLLVSFFFPHAFFLWYSKTKSITHLALGFYTYRGETIFWIMMPA